MTRCFVCRRRIRVWGRDWVDTIFGRVCSRECWQAVFDEEEPHE